MGCVSSKGKGKERAPSERWAKQFLAPGQHFPVNGGFVVGPNSNRERTQLASFPQSERIVKHRGRYYIDFGNEGGSHGLVGRFPMPPDYEPGSSDRHRDSNLQHQSSHRHHDSSLQQQSSRRHHDSNLQHRSSHRHHDSNLQHQGTYTHGGSRRHESQHHHEPSYPHESSHRHGSSHHHGSSHRHGNNRHRESRDTYSNGRSGFGSGNGVGRLTIINSEAPSSLRHGQGQAAQHRHHHQHLEPIEETSHSNGAYSRRG